MAKDLKLTARLENRASKEIEKIISDLDRLAKTAASTSARQATQAESNARRAIGSEERVMRERIRIQRASAALADRQEQIAANRSARANANSLQESRDIAEATLKVQRKAALAEASLVENRFDRRIAIERVRHGQILADLKGNHKSMEAETRRFNAVVSRIQMDKDAFPTTPFQKLLGHLDVVTGHLGVRLPDAAGRASAALGQSGSAGLTTVAAGAAVGLVALGAASAYAYTQAREQEDADKRLSAVLRATGGAAGITFGELQKMAGALQETTDFTDDAVQGAQAILLRFDSIGKDVFPRALAATADLAAETGDLSGAASGLGRALESPIEAGRSLKSMNVVLSKSQREQIELYVESGDKAKAQAVILDAVEKTYKGNAEAMSHSTTKLKNHIGELAEVMGRPLVSAVDAAADAMLRYLKASSSEKYKEKVKQYSAQVYGLNAVAVAAAKASEEVEKVEAPKAKEETKKKELSEDQEKALKDLEKRLQSIKLDAQQDTTKKAIEAAKIERDELLKVHAGFLEAKTIIDASYQQQVENAKAEARKKEIDELKEEADAQFEANAERNAAIREQKYNHLLSEREMDKRMAKQEEDDDEKEKKRTKDTEDFKLSAKKQFYGGFSDLMQVMAKKNKALARVAQGISIAEAIANTSVAFTKALASGLPPFNYIAAAGVAASGAAQVATISSQRFARGTDSAPGGMALVGEQGPEMVYLPKGSKVSTAQETKSSMGGVTHSGPVIFNIAMPTGSTTSQAREMGSAMAGGYLDRIKNHRRMDEEAEYYLGSRR